MSKQFHLGQKTEVTIRERGGGYPGMVKDHTMSVFSCEGFLKVDKQKLFAFYGSIGTLGDLQNLHLI